MTSEASARPSSAATQSLLPVVVLVTICMVSGVLLGFVHTVTEPIAQANAEAKAQETYAQLLPEAASFEQVAIINDELDELEGVRDVLVAKDEAGGVVGHVVVAEARGYGGQVPLAVAFDPSGTVRAISAMDNDETPGLGTKIAADGYLDQYVGRAAVPLEAADVDFISGATISSKAALAAFDRAVAAYEEVC